MILFHNKAKRTGMVHMIIGIFIYAPHNGFYLAAVFASLSFSLSPSLPRSFE